MDDMWRTKESNSHI